MTCSELLAAQFLLLATSCISTQPNESYANGSLPNGNIPTQPSESLPTGSLSNGISADAAPTPTFEPRGVFAVLEQNLVPGPAYGDLPPQDVQERTDLATQAGDMNQQAGDVKVFVLQLGPVGEQETVNAFLCRHPSEERNFLLQKIGPRTYSKIEYLHSEFL